MPDKKPVAKTKKTVTKTKKIVKTKKAPRATEKRTKKTSFQTVTVKDYTTDKPALTDKELALLRAVCPPQVVERVLAAKTLNDPIYDNGGTFLHGVADEGNAQLVQSLLQAGADVNVTDNNDITPLIAAAYRGHTDIVQMLLYAGAKVDAKTVYGWTALMNAADEGHTEIVRLLLAAKADVNATESERNWTALMFASQHGHNETVKLLLDAGAVIDARDSGGGTALMDACYNGHLDTVKLLLSAGANINATSKRGEPVLHFAQIGNQAAVIRFLRARGAKTAQELARAYGAQENTKPSVTSNVRPSAQTGDKAVQDKFIRACRWGSLGEVQQCLLQGADINGASLGQTPLKNAILSGKIPVVQVLLEYGAAVTDAEIRLAQNHKNEDIIRLLKSAIGGK